MAVQVTRRLVRQHRSAIRTVYFSFVCIGLEAIFLSQDSWTPVSVCWHIHCRALFSLPVLPIIFKTSGGEKISPSYSKCAADSGRCQHLAANFPFEA